MSDQDLRRSLVDIRLGAAALGVCIARTLAKQNPIILQSLAAEADWMHKHLCEKHSRPEISEILVSFSLALAHPDKFPLFTPSADN